MSAAKHTPGPWAAFYKAKYDEWHVSVPIAGSSMKWALFDDGIRSENPEADARLIAAAPELKSVAENFEVTGPDADGLVWLVLHGRGTSARAMFNLGSSDRVAAQVALLLEQDRRAAIAKAGGAL